MAYPSVVYGSFGDEKVTSTSKIGSLPLGTRMELPDGRTFRHARVGGTALVSGKLYEGKAAETNAIYTDATVAPNAAAINATSISITNSGTILAAGVFNDGYLWTASSVGTGVGYVYKVKSHAAGTAASTIVINLYENDKVAVALESGTTTVGLRRNEYDLVVLTVASTVRTNTLCGVSCSSAAASSYVWLQTKGPAAVLSDGALLIGQGCVASTVAAGAVGPVAGTAAGTTWSANHVIGQVMAVAAASLKYALIDINIR